MTLILPQLPGLAWPVDVDFGGFDTTVETAVSGKETRYINRVQARRHYSLAYDALDSSGGFPGVTANSLQTLAGFFNRCYGGGLMFQFWDPSDCAASAEQFGVGDGTTTAFQLAKSDGGWVDNVFAPFIATAPTLIPSPAAPSNPSANVYAPINLWQYSVRASDAGLTTLGAVTLTNGQADPNGGTLGVLIAETATTASHFARPGAATILAGSPVTFSCYLKQSGARYVALFLDNGATNGHGVNFDLSAGVVIATSTNGAPKPVTATITDAGGGWWRCAMSGAVDTSSTIARASVAGVNNAAVSPGWYLSYAGSTSNSVLFAFPQIEIDTVPGVPGPFMPTLATRYYGSPSISVAGAYVDPTTYSINANTGLVTFTSAPTSGAALTWTGNYYWWANFDDDKFSASQFMGGLWEAKKLGFTTRVF